MPIAVRRTASLHSPMAGGASSTPQPSLDSLARWNTGSPAFAGDDNRKAYGRYFFLRVEPDVVRKNSGFSFDAGR